MLPAIGDFAEVISPLLQSYGYAALFLLLLVEECGVPLLLLPGYLVLVWAGYRFGAAGADPLPLLLLSTLAVALGSSVLYALCGQIGSRVLAPAARRARIAPRRPARLDAWLDRYGFAAVVAGRLIPGLRIPTSAAAGAVGVRRTVFLPGTLLAAALWTGFYFLLGMALSRL